MLICFIEGCTWCFSNPCISVKIKENRVERMASLMSFKDTPDLAFVHYAAYGRDRNSEIDQHAMELGCNDHVAYNNSEISLNYRFGMKTKISVQNNAKIYVANVTGVKKLLLASYDFFLSFNFLEEKQRLALKGLVDKFSLEFSTNKPTAISFLSLQNNLVKLVLVASGSLYLARYILAIGYDLEYRVPKQKWTALHCALILGKFDNAKLLIEEGANVDAVDAEGRTPLRHYKDAEQVDEKSEFLLTLLKLTSMIPDEKGVTGVEAILGHGSSKSVRALLQNGANVGLNFSKGQSLLHVLTANNNPGVLEVLIELDIPFDANARKSNGETALMIAAKVAGPINKVEFLLRHGADVNLTWDGRSALFYAAEHYFRAYRLFNNENTTREKIIAILLQNGADAQLMCDTGETFLDYLSRHRTVISPCIKLIVAHLALLAAIDESNVNFHTRVTIQSNEQIKAQFDLYMQQLAKIRNAEAFYGSVTLFQLFSEREEKIVAYARNEELIVAFDDAIKAMTHLEPYYFDYLNNRMTRAKNEVELIEKAALVIEALTGVYHAIAYKIIIYFDYRDMINLCRFGNKFFVGK